MEFSNKETIAAISTPPGVGGIAVIRISGPEARGIAAAVFKPKNTNKLLENMPGYTAAYGTFVRDGAEIDEGVALVFAAPHSYTGEDVVELSCHGGHVVSEEILTVCLEAGAGTAQRGEFTKRAFLNGKLQLTEAESVMDLISANSTQAANAAKATLSGKLTQEILQIKEKLMEQAVHLAAWIDYPEEDVDEVDHGQLLEVLEHQLGKIDELVQNYQRGALLRRGVRAVIAGSPNVGKSTLFNCLSGYDRAIVTEQAGTTRDVLREEVQLGGIPLHILDTAGIHDDTQDIIELEGIKRSKSALESADLLIYVIDGSRPLAEDELQRIQALEGKVTLGILNKSDLGIIKENEELAQYFTDAITLSALDRSCLPELERAIMALLRLDELDTDAAMLCNKRQLEAALEAQRALTEAVGALQNGITYDAASVCLQDAIEALARLTGENVSDEIIDAVFEQFCVGK